MAGPALDGADHITVSLDTDAGSTVGAFGLPGASVFTSVTVTVIVWVAVLTRSPSPLVAVTSTTYVLFVPWSLASSKFGTVLKVRAPSVAPISNSASSAPPVIA